MLRRAPNAEREVVRPRRGDPRERVELLRAARSPRAPRPPGAGKRRGPSRGPGAGESAACGRPDPLRPGAWVRGAAGGLPRGARPARSWAAGTAPPTRCAFCRAALCSAGAPAPAASPPPAAAPPAAQREINPQPLRVFGDFTAAGARPGGGLRGGALRSLRPRAVRGSEAKGSPPPAPRPPPPAPPASPSEVPETFRSGEGSRGHAGRGREAGVAAPREPDADPEGRGGGSRQADLQESERRTGGFGERAVEIGREMGGWT